MNDTLFFDAIFKEFHKKTLKKQPSTEVYPERSRGTQPGMRVRVLPPLPK